MGTSILIHIATVMLIVVVVMYGVMTKLSNPEKLLRPISGELSPARQAIVLQHQEWLAAQGYQFLTSFQFSTIQVVVFQQTDAPRYFNLNFHKSTTYDLVTRFDDTRSLTTATSDSIGMIPPAPGCYKQGFPRAAADLALQRHLEAETYLINKFGIVCQAVTKPYEQLLIDGMRAEVAHVKSMPLWPIRGIYWYFVNRTRMANRTIQEQFP
jgi:hypothetical protein